ncbi:hypothetical protein BAUCODRAFT_31490 [Baudoinia panamericana UAMH 10762]|uniref:Uncharacterized protein n=1 Tax=Baudoinia panamericana (strain UAMH 10762) TaxID=717646 RepID=M2NIF8_BAUPA|nr:uncharacterized protein BAUCODRAFT_31490 [Baudoinia panamericana UAMH 10762]EMC99169.1 hypothetical protein BAUCODRAFT_31490 [Baudoinia panamericana UAMH 10762]
MSTSAATSKSSSKTPRKSLKVRLRLSPKILAKFPSDITPKPSIATPAIEPLSSAQLHDATDKTSDSNGTPMPAPSNETGDGNTLAPPKVDRRRRGGAGISSGRKRAPPSIDPNGPMRERGRPGPKKKPRFRPDGTIDRSNDGTRPAPVTAPSRLGPKANTGNINANLRALDRSGKPCRRWERKPLHIKSFTGVMWGMPSWKAPQRDNGFAGDVKSDSTGSSDLKRNDSSAVGSDRSHSGMDVGDTTMMNGIESSPAPPVPA